MAARASGVKMGFHYVDGEGPVVPETAPEKT